LSGLVGIPDSVEVLSFHEHGRYLLDRTLTFGRDSRLRELRVVSHPCFIPTRSFLQVASRSLKEFRAEREFE
jgi:hypothetical protein